MVRAISARVDVSKGDEGPKGIVIETVSGKEVTMIVVSCSGPEISYLGWFNIATLERRTGQCRRWGLQDHPWWQEGAERNGDTGNRRNDRRQ